MKPCMDWFDAQNPHGMWHKIAKIQERDRQHEQQRAQEEQAKAAARSSGGFSAGVKHRLSPGEVWRATDFWREGLKEIVREDIKQNNKRNLLEDTTNYTKIQKAKREQKLPAEFFVDVKGWLWSVKEDGYLVKLIRDEENKWSMRTRKDTLLFPPPTFLQGLEQNKELPSFMIGELVTNFTGCDEDSRNDTDKRNKKRNEQFGKLNRVLHDKHGKEDVWNGLRVKIFSFPHSSMDMQDVHSRRSMKETYEHYSKVMQKTLKYHPHIGMCRFGTLSSTQHAIDIFNIVVQLGLEGIVIVHAHVQYGALTDHKHDNAQFFFKLKQKIVLPGTLITYLGKKERSKDGELQADYEYSIKDENQRTIKFIDQQHRKTNTYSRIKYMEFVPGDDQDEGFNQFPCIQGYRHMHFANLDDESVQVPALQKPGQNFALDASVKEVLAWNSSRNRILNWDQLQDSTELDKIKLFNPKPFAKQEALLRDYRSPPSSPRRLTKRSQSGVFAHVQDWRDSDSDDPEDDAAENKQKETPYDVQHRLPQAADHSVSKSEPWPAPNAEDSEWIQMQWAFRSKPREEDSEILRRAYDEATLRDLRREEKKEKEQREDDTNMLEMLETQICELEAERQELETQIFQKDGQIDEETKKKLYLRIQAIAECRRQKWIKEREIESKQKAKEIALQNLKERAALRQKDMQASNMYYIISSFRNI